MLEGYTVEGIEGDIPFKIVKLRNIGAYEFKEIGANGVFIVMELKPSTVMIKQAGIQTIELVVS